ncbi:MAG: hypothetical protein GC184_14925 [Rhizobiales bacterium]|nr:hypothetical protein [Hyphomicrobiales bacterium]
MPETGFTIHKRQAPFGAEICGVDLSRRLDAQTCRQLDHALWQHELLIFRNQQLSQIALSDVPRQTGWARDQFECSRVEPVLSAENLILQTDPVWQAAPPLVSLLYVPEGAAVSESLFASRRETLRHLSGPMRKYLEQLTALHDASCLWRMNGVPSLSDLSTMVSMRRNAPLRQASLLGVHPLTWEATLDFSSVLTTQIDGVGGEESDAILGMLRDLMNRPECQMRLRLEPGTLLIWDNHALQHHPVGAFDAESRPMWHMAVQAPAPLMNDLDERLRRIS